MTYPDFFADVPRLALRDPLAEFLGASSGGVIEYGYADAVRLAGHSCPTVASAYWLTWRGLRALYGDDLPERGAIRAAFRDDSRNGVTGVIANVVAMLTGAAGDSGFKGLAGQFDRRGLLVFAAGIPLDMRLTRLDTGAAVDLAADLRRVPAAPEMAQLLQLALGGGASPEQRQRFGALWQARVRSVLLEHGDDPEVFVVRPAGGVG